MVRLFVKLAGGFFHGCGGGKHQFQQLVHPQVDLLLGQAALGDRLQQLACPAQTRGGHFQRRTVLHALHMVVGAAPVGDDCAVKAPLLAQDIHQQVMVLVSIDIVHLVVGGHDGLGVRLLDHDLKGGKVQLPQGALVQHRVAGHAAQFLTIYGKMLGAGGNAVFLNAPDVGGCHLAGKVGVLGEILKAASAQGAALHVQARAQQYIHPVRGGLLAQCPAHFFTQRRVPAVGHGGGGGKTGSGHTGVQAQMVGCARLLTQTVGAVRQPDGGHALLGVVLRLPSIFAGQQGTFLFKGKLLENFRVFHSVSSYKKRAAMLPHRRPWAISVCRWGCRPQRCSPRSLRQRRSWCRCRCR